MAAYQYIFVMQNLTKVLPGGRELFKDITLSFLPGFLFLSACYFFKIIVDKSFL